MDYEAAANPAASGRPLEMFIDASDYGWSATLTQRPTPHAAPKVISIVAKGFTDVQQRWSAMERELFALWQGVVGTVGQSPSEQEDVELGTRVARV